MQRAMRVIRAPDNFERCGRLVNRIWRKAFGALTTLPSASQVQLEVVDRGSLFVEYGVLFYWETLRKHCATGARMVIKLVLRARANRT
jgi:hypothetical protein